MTLVRRRGRPAHKGQASKALTSPSLSNGDQKDPLESNEPGPSEAPEAPIGPLEAPLPTPPAPDVARYMRKDMNYLLQTFLQASKSGSGDKLQAKTPDVYRNKSHMECYNFC